MATAQGDYTNAAYLERVPVNGIRTLGGAATTTYQAFYGPSGISSLRLRSASLIVTASNTAASTWTYYNGTTSIGKVVFGTASGVAVNTVVTIPDMNTTLAAGTGFGFVSGADAAGTAVLMLEVHVDPAGTFSGNP